MNFEQTVDPTFSLCDVQRSHIKSLVASVPTFESEYRNKMIIGTWFAEYNPTDSSVEYAVGEQGGQKVVEEGFKMICASSKQKIDAKKMSVRCVSFKSFSGTFNSLDSSRQSSCREWQTHLRKICAWTTRICPWKRRSWTKRENFSYSRKCCLQKPLSRILMTIWCPRDSFLSSRMRLTSDAWSSVSWWRRMPIFLRWCSR